MALGRFSGGLRNNEVKQKHISDDAVGLPEMAAGTDGEIMSWDASGDPVAIAVGTTGTPLITKGAGAVPVFETVGTAGLKTTTELHLTTSPTPVLFTLTGGEYTFWPIIRMDSTSGAANSAVHILGVYQINASWLMTAATLGTTLTARATLVTADANNVEAQFRYFQSSPPYDLGDGEVPFFIWMTINNSTGRPVSMSMAEDPPWANNGPTRVAVDGLDGRGDPLVRRRKPLPYRIRAALDDPALRDELLAAISNPEYELVPLTQTIKQADMPIFPHPQMDNDITGKSLIMLDPVSGMMQDLAGLHREMSDADTGESVATLISADYIRFDNTALTRSTPPGVIAVAPRWK